LARSTWLVVRQAHHERSFEIPLILSLSKEERGSREPASAMSDRPAMSEELEVV
jgi:hypothetical protein